MSNFREKERICIFSPLGKIIFQRLSLIFPGEKVSFMARG